MKQFISSTMSLSIGITLISLWQSLINETMEGIGYKQWMILILWIGCGFIVGSAMVVLKWYNEKYKN